MNGSAELVNDPAMLERLAGRGTPAILAIRVRVEERFFHCAKAFGSNLWKPDTWPKHKRISFGAMFDEGIESHDPTVAEAIDAMVEQDYQTDL